MIVTVAVSAVGTLTAAMYVSSSLAVSPFVSIPPHTCGGLPTVPVPGHRNRSVARVSDQIGYALFWLAESQT